MMRSDSTNSAVLGKSHSRLAVLLLFTALLTGCPRPYSTSVVDPQNAQFPGITKHWQRPAGADVRVLFVHGICTHTESTWITNGWDVVMKGYFPSETMTPKPIPPVGEVQIVDHEYEIGTNKISGRFLIWSPLTAGDKAKLNFDDPPSYTNAPGEFTWRRATLNSILKSQLLNDCLSDAVIYAGYRGAELQAALQNAICASLDGTITNDTCEFPETYAHGDRRIVIVTESLGSRMVFDAITTLKTEAENKGETALARFDAAVSPITQIFMLANQLPIFALARPALNSSDKPIGVESSPTPSMVTALSVLSKARVRHRSRQRSKGEAPTFEGQIGLVAFTDPNDLLSYRIPPGDTAILRSGATVTNVITSNSDTYFWYVEDPYPAHTAYNQTNDVLRLLFGGSSRATSE